MLLKPPLQQPVEHGGQKCDDRPSAPQPGHRHANGILCAADFANAAQRRTVNTTLAAAALFGGHRAQSLVTEDEEIGGFFFPVHG